LIGVISAVSWGEQIYINLDYELFTK
jgi:hypothetical protein